ncbi:MAG: TIGR03621 family F420-dependent LLM class oxidoreductase, partial [Acidimicrobiaceae bacterium]|nr:TIGR03621 family F420-dependent LLM class oxidoreductase [Acidimicrobiaceae bacterium]
MAKGRPFRFGTGCYLASRSRAEYIDSVRRIEEMGYSILLCPDHFADWLGPLTSLMMAAEASSTLRIGTFVLANDFRHPAVLAKEAATLDLLSGGRLELGLGTGYSGPDYTRTGVRMETAGIRVSRFMESVQVIKGLFSDGPVDFSGTYYTVQGLEGTPKPVQRPHPPLLIAGGSRRILSFAGREADIVGLIPRTRGGGIEFSEGQAASTAQQVEWVREGAGDRFADLELNTMVFNVVVTDHPRRAAEEIAVTVGVSPDLVLESIHFRVGTVDQMVDEIQMWRERFGISYIAVQEEDREALAPVV